MTLKPLVVTFVFTLGLLLMPGNLSAPAQTAPDSASAPLLSEQDLEQVVAPIALYPDPMVALILQASTVPTDIVLASRWIGDGNDTDDIDSQPWDDSVKGLARYPDVLDMMDDNLDWTNQLGAAVLAQPADVMTAIQAMRAKAQALGNLQTTAQQQVVSQDNVIQIVPADPQVIYVPVYDPTVIYFQPAPPIIFGPGLSIGIWLGGGFDWRYHRFYRGGYYRPGYGWRPRPPNGGIIWRPNPNRPRPRPPYRPGKPGHLPGWQRPPNGGKPRPPGNGRPPGNTNPRPPGSKPRPPIGGPGNPGNRPGGPGNRPGRPSIQPVPNKPGGGKPAPRPEKPVTIQPVKPRPETKPAPRPQRPEKPVTTQPVKPRPAERPQVKPAPSRPAVQPKPARPHQDFNQSRPSSKPRPAPSRPAASRPAARPAPAADKSNRK